MAGDGAEAQERESQFRRVYEENLTTIYNHVGARVPNRSDIPDLVAEVFATAWRRIDQMPVGPESRAWLVGVSCRHRVRRRCRCTTPEGPAGITTQAGALWVIPEGALFVKAALLEEEHDFGVVGSLST